MTQVNSIKSFRVAAYIDGFNLYYGLRSRGWRRFYWLDLAALSRSLLLPSQTLVFGKYFTSRVTLPPEKQRRQALYLDALASIPAMALFFGHYLSTPRQCPFCKRTHVVPTEKMTDVNIATELLADAFLDRFDTALLVSADSDLTGPIRKVRELFPHKRILIAFPPNRFSVTLARAAHVVLYIESHHLAKSQLPDQITKPDGFVLHRPREWR